MIDYNYDESIHSSPKSDEIARNIPAHFQEISIREEKLAFVGKNILTIFHGVQSA